MPTCAKCENEGTHRLSRFLNVRESWGGLVLVFPIGCAISFGLGALITWPVTDILGLSTTTQCVIAGIFATMFPINLAREMVQTYREYRRTGPKYLCDACYREATHVETTTRSDDDSFIMVY